jgi:hypothetical protein
VEFKTLQRWIPVNFAQRLLATLDRYFLDDLENRRRVDRLKIHEVNNWAEMALDLMHIITSYAPVLRAGLQHVAGNLRAL